MGTQRAPPPADVLAEASGTYPDSLSRPLRALASVGRPSALFDQPHVVANAVGLLRAAGVGDRCQIVGGSFFENVPEGADAYVLKAIIHDWEDEEAAAILARCRHAVPDDGVLLLVEWDIGPPNEGRAAKFSDLNMLVAPGGRERTIAEYAALLAKAGFRLDRAVPTHPGLSIMEEVAA